MFAPRLKLGILTLCLSATLSAQDRHWSLENGEAWLLQSFGKDAPDLFIEPIEQPGIYPINNFVFGQDSLGRLWLSNEEGKLIRYDGRNFKKINPIGQENTRFRVVSAMDSTQNCIWRPMKGGLSCMDIKSGKLTLHKNTLKPSDSISITTYLDEKRQQVIVSFGVESNGYLAVFDTKKQEFTHYLDAPIHDAYNGQSLPVPTSFMEIGIDQAGVYWVCALIEKDNVLLSYNPDKREFLAYPFHQMRENGQLEANPNSLGFLQVLPDSDGRHIWVSGFTGGLKCFDKLTRRWKQYMVNVPEHDFAANCIVDIAQWDDNTLLLASNLGMHLFDKQTKRLYNYQFFEVNAASHFSKTVFKITKDRDGNAWITSSSGGLFKLDPHKQFFRRRPMIPENFAPFDFYKDKERGLTWFAGTNYSQTDNPIFLLDEKTGLGKYLQSPPHVFHFCPDPKLGHILSGSSSKGILKIDLAKKKFAPMHQPIKGLPNVHADELKETHLARHANGHLWAASSTYGLIKGSPDGSVWEQVYPRFTGDTLLVSSGLRNVFCDKKGRIWLTAPDRDEVICLQNPHDDPAKWKAVKMLPIPGKGILGDVWAYNFAETADGSIWVNGWRRLFRILPDSDSLELVPNIEPYNGTITTDSEGNLWVNGWGSLHYYKVATDSWKTWRQKDGFPQAPLSETMSICREDELFFTPGLGWHSSDVRFNEHLPRPIFTSVKVNEHEVLPDQDLNAIEMVRLEAGQNAFTIEFSATNYTNPDANQFAYQLSDVDKDWVYCGTRNSASFTQLRPGHYTFLLKSANNDGIWNERPIELKLYIPPFFYQTVWFKLLVGLGILALILYLWKNRLNAAKQEALLLQREAELKQQAAEYQRQLAEVEMSALRSQMNPHFIFNVLNSINRYTLDNNAETASTYLTKFARLVRLVLENSRSGNVTLESDLAALELYIEMEALRFKDKVRWAIEVEPGIDQKYLRIPPMLIQPYVENAIWHGLMHKREGGTVVVRISQPTENQLLVEVEDNGIGRTAAAELKSKSAVERKSFGMQITSQRLALVNKLYQTDLQVEVLDLVDVEGGAAGTRVVLRVPV
jgi:streptogramin lyase